MNFKAMKFLWHICNFFLRIAKKLIYRSKRIPVIKAFNLFPSSKQTKSYNNTRLV